MNTNYKVIIYKSIQKTVSQADCPNGEVQTLNYVLILNSNTHVCQYRYTT